MNDEPVSEEAELEAAFRTTCADAAFAQRAAQLSDGDTDDDHEALTAPTEEARVDAARRVAVPPYQPFEAGVTRLTMVLKEVQARREAAATQLEACRR